MKEFEVEFIEYLNANHRDALDSLKSGKLEKSVIDTIENVCADLSAKYA